MTKRSMETKINISKIAKYCELLLQYGSLVTYVLRKNFTYSSCHKYRGEFSFWGP